MLKSKDDTTFEKPLEKKQWSGTTAKSFWAWDNLNSSAPVLFYCYQWQVLQTARLLSIQIYQWLSLSREAILSLLRLTRERLFRENHQELYPAGHPHNSGEWECQGGLRDLDGLKKLQTDPLCTGFTPVLAPALPSHCPCLNDKGNAVVCFEWFEASIVNVLSGDEKKRKLDHRVSFLQEFMHVFLSFSWTDYLWDCSVSHTCSLPSPSGLITNKYISKSAGTRVWVCLVFFFASSGVIFVFKVCITLQETPCRSRKWAEISCFFEFSICVQ